MNFEFFSKWLKEWVSPKMKEMWKTSVLVLDRATYHTVVTENSKRPTTAWNKAKITDAIRRWGGPEDKDWTILWHKLNKKINYLTKL